MFGRLYSVSMLLETQPCKVDSRLRGAVAVQAPRFYVRLPHGPETLAIDVSRWSVSLKKSRGVSFYFILQKNKSFSFEALKFN